MAKARKTKEQELPLEKTLWLAADKLRKNIDAAEYKHIVLGLIFLKYISDAFEELYNNFIQYNGADFENDETLLAEFKDECLAENVFYVPPTARWTHLMAEAKKPTIGKTVDDAMDAIEKENKSLKNVLPKQYARENLDKTSLGGLIDQFSNITIGDKASRAKDVLGKVYEYFLGQFALAEGKKGGQFYTPKGVVQLLVQMLEPYKGRVYDPCCGSGGMFVQSEEFILNHQGKIDDINIYGQESNQTTWRLAKMNLAIRGINSEHIKWNTEGSFLKDAHPDLKADYIIANPPFNDNEWSGELLRSDGRWKYGIPPTSNANFAWIQHFIYHLSPKGRAGIVMHCGAASNKGLAETNIRKELLKANLIECIVTLPTQLFYNTNLPVHLWFFSRQNKIKSDKVLMIDAYNLGEMVESTHRELSENDIIKISKTYHNWRTNSQNYTDEEGFCKEVLHSEIEQKSFVLAPNRYVEKVKKKRDSAYKELFERKLESSQKYIHLTSQLICNNSFISQNLLQNFLKRFSKENDKSFWAETEIGNVIDYTISGNWGNHAPKKDNVPVKVLRGTDLPNIPMFNLKKTPTRYISSNKLKEISLSEGDIIIELSGGSKDQPTGRCAIVTHELIEYFNLPVICSNFCKAIRLNKDIINPYWFLLYWQQAYNDNLTTRYENQPSGIKNFQLDEFISSEIIMLPPIDVQNILIENLIYLFELKNKISFLAQNLSEVIERAFDDLYYEYI